MTDTFKKMYCGMLHFPFEGRFYSIFNISVNTQNQITG